MGWKIGVDGGGTKTECILLDPAGAVAARHLGPGCNPSIVGAPRAREILLEALAAVRAGHPAVAIASTLLCAAGSRPFWAEVARDLAGFGRTEAVDDSLPVLELATGGGPGLALHAGTGSFVAVRDSSGAVHYAGGLGWRFGDEGSGYDLGRRALARAFLEFQGSVPASGLGPMVAARAATRDLPTLIDRFYRQAAPNAEIAAFAPAVLALAQQGDAAAGEVVAASVDGLLALAEQVAARFFPGSGPVAAGVSGAILNHPVVTPRLARVGRFRLTPITAAPIEGVRLMLLRS